MGMAGAANREQYASRPTLETTPRLERSYAASGSMTAADEHGVRRWLWRRWLIPWRPWLIPWTLSPGMAPLTGRTHRFMGCSGALQGLFRAARQNVPYKFPIRHLRGSAVPGFSGMAATPERD